MNLLLKPIVILQVMMWTALLTGCSSLQATRNAPAISFQTWRQGEPPVRLIAANEGFAALSLVTGSFQGGGEVVKVWIGPDGYWYLGGLSQQEGVAAQCVIVRIR